MDGEGTITIKRVLRKDMKNRYYQLYISCAQVDKDPNTSVIESFKEWFGGNVSKWTQRPQDGNRINTVCWSVVSNDALKFLEIIHPYLKVKKQQALLGIQFQRGIVPRGRAGLSLDDMKIKEDCFYQMRRFNVKGKLQLQRLSEETPQGDAIV